MKYLQLFDSFGYEGIPSSMYDFIEKRALSVNKDNFEKNFPSFCIYYAERLRRMDLDSQEFKDFEEKKSELFNIVKENPQFITTWLDSIKPVMDILKLRGVI